MTPLRRAIAIILTDKDRRTLTTWSPSRTAAAQLVTRAKIVRRAAAGSENRQIAEEFGVNRATVKTWRDRFAAMRLAGLETGSRRPRP